MRSSTEPTASPHAAAPAPPPVRPARFDRPLSGVRAAVLGAGWGDPALDAALAEALEEGRRQGLAQGYAGGWAAGRRAAAEREQAESAARAAAAEDERLARLARAGALLDALAQATRDAAATVAPSYEELAGVLADGVLALTRAALARELAAVDDDLVQRVRVALRAVAGDGRLVLTLHPDDAAELRGVALPDRAELVADPAVARGGVDVRGEVRRLRLDVPAAVAAAEEVLRP